MKVNLRTAIEKSWSMLFKEWSLIVINVPFGCVTSKSEIYWNYQKENKENCKPWVCRSEVKARNTGSHELVVEFSSSPDNLSYFSDCPTSYLNLHLVMNVAAQNYNLSHWTVLFSYHNSPAWKIFKRVRGKNSFEKLALDYFLKPSSSVPTTRGWREDTSPQNLNTQKK